MREILDELEPQGILLSGGIDSGLLACLMPQLKAITVMFEDRAQDKPYIDILERHLGLRVETVKVSMEEALSAIPTVIRILRSFDPALPNDLAVYFGLKALAERGTKRVATGDGGDELFGG
ncbi:MAG: asparagine synthase, partial [Deltaproteobacteria bacterium]